MQKFIKTLKIIFGVLFGLSALSLLSYLPYFGITIHFGAALFQGSIAFFLLRSAFAKNNSKAADQKGELNGDQEV